MTTALATPVLATPVLATPAPSILDLADDRRPVNTDVSATSLPTGRLPEGKLEYLNLTNPNLIFYDADSYGRNLNEARLNILRASWDRQKAGVVLVSRRRNPNIAVKEKLMVVIDGHHRVTVALEKGEVDLPALVWDNLTLQQEAALYAAFGSVLRQSPMQVFRARLIAGDSQAAKLAAWISDAGFALDMPGSGAPEWDRLSSVKMLENSFRKYGANHLYNTLRLIRDAFPAERKRTRNVIFQAMSMFLRYYPEFDRERLVKRVEDIGFATLISQGNGLAHSLQVTAPHGFGTALVRAYNKHGGYELEQWDRRVPLKEYTDDGKAKTRAAVSASNRTRTRSRKNGATARTAVASKTPSRRHASVGKRRVVWNPVELEGRPD